MRSFNNLISYSPAPDALQEMKVLTANAPANFGNVNGGGVVSILKSGTNSFHGSAYGYVQDYRLDANSWQNNQTVPITPINPFSQAQFGGSFGGPIKRDKLFFFVDYLGSRYHKGGTGSASVFTSAMRGGDFSVLLSGSNPIQLYDPENGFAPYAGNKGVPVNQSRLRSSCLPIRTSIRCPMRHRRMGSSTTTTRDPRETTKPTIREISRLSTIRGARTRLRAFIPCPRRMTDRRRCCPSSSQASICFRRRWSARTGCIRFRRI